MGKVRDELGGINDDVDQHPAAASHQIPKIKTIQPGTESIMEMVIFHTAVVIIEHAVESMIDHASILYYTNYNYPPILPSILSGTEPTTPKYPPTPQSSNKPA